MTTFQFRDGTLWCEEVPLEEIASRAGTPCYVYSLTEARERLRAYRRAFPSALIAYAFKANPALSLARLLAGEGAGADVVSAGELRQALRASFPPERIVFNGNGKTAEELAEAAGADVLAINLDAPAELERLPSGSSVAVRVNPSLDPRTHPHLATGALGSKFGLPAEEALSLLRRAAEQGYRPVGFHVHAGSQVRDVAVLGQAAGLVAGLSRRALDAGLSLTHINLGGGLAITYSGHDGPQPDDLAEALWPALADLPLVPILEPGRSLVGPAGALLTRVLHTKGDFAVVDTGMHHLLRPVLYGAYHRVWPVREDKPQARYHLVGPICESADVLATDRPLPRLVAGDLLALLDTGAYGMALASRYNARALPAEAAVEGDRWHLLRPLEEPDAHFEAESVPPWLA